MPNDKNGDLRQPAEILFAEELDALIKAEKHPVPAGWRMSPRSVLTYICGGKCGTLEITPKYIGHQRLVEIAISTLVTDRALLLIGEPGTAKSWLSEHLAAAINGDSTKVVQGTAGTTEEQIRYTWNYAMLIARGPSHEALIKSPIFRAMESGTLARFEEITRCASEVQDALISLLSEKRLSVPELATEVPAQRASRSSPPPTPATAASTTCPPPSSGASTSSCCPPRRTWKRKSTSSASASANWRPTSS